MNFAALLGVIFGVGITAFSILTSTKHPQLFMNEHAFVLVIGGTLTVALLTFNFPRLFGSAKVIFRKMFGKGRVDYLGEIKNIVEIANVYRVDPKNVMNTVPKNAHPFLRDCLTTMVEFGFNSDELDAIIANALKGKKSRDSQEVKVWQTISRFPPAFGLLGATLGMISLLETLGEPGSQERIGPAMAVALVATFYGLLVANLFLIPISEKLLEVSAEDYMLRSIIKEGVLLIQEKRHPVFIEEYLKSFLSPSQRKMEMGAGAGAKSGGAKNAA